MRLQLDPFHPDIYIADTPNIHDLPIPRTLHGHSSTLLTAQYGTIDLSKVTGLTLFFEKGRQLVTIFGHTVHQPYALPPQELKTWQQLDAMVWVYVPLPKSEKILSLSRGYSKHHDWDFLERIPLCPNYFVSITQNLTLNTSAVGLTHPSFPRG